MQVKKKQLELDMAQQTGSELGEDHIMAVPSHTYSFYKQMQKIKPGKILPDPQVLA